MHNSLLFSDDYFQVYLKLGGFKKKTHPVTGDQSHLKFQEAEELYKLHGNFNLPSLLNLPLAITWVTIY